MDQPSPDADPASPPSVPRIPLNDPSTLTLLDQLTEDRLWLLQQIDGGRWPDLRLDLAALERELGQLLDQARQRLEPG
ncbi:hypothetical protein BBFGKLBO_02290 [Synechococcus sp. CBW1107]|uniref:hypothetical protein n=1 Tax=Synechococcus sp. CBW1107 TaxID=2789857 RepID=UPI001E60EF6D|nr:hypothetical protein [Synechococcus sp. CBW1107]CAK6697618.1 hypothetical protein BBFGKLBO_02290 [Synechococcus sp. CBW1107]